jgi:hypothetical protein
MRIAFLSLSRLAARSKFFNAVLAPTCKLPPHDFRRCPSKTFLRQPPAPKKIGEYPSPQLGHSSLQQKIFAEEA